MPKDAYPCTVFCSPQSRSSLSTTFWIDYVFDVNANAFCYCVTYGFNFYRNDFATTLNGTIDLHTLF